MQDKTASKADDVAGLIGAVAFTVFLIIDLRRLDVHPAWIVFDAAMLAYCLGHTVTWLPWIDELRSSIVKALITALIGQTLAAAFFYFAVTAANSIQLLLALAVMIGGACMLTSGVRRLREIHRAIKSVTGDQR